MFFAVNELMNVLSSIIFESHSENCPFLTSPFLPANNYHYTVFATAIYVCTFVCVCVSACVRVCLRACVVYLTCISRTVIYTCIEYCVSVNVYHVSAQGRLDERVINVHYHYQSARTINVWALRASSLNFRASDGFNLFLFFFNS